MERGYKQIERIFAAEYKVKMMAWWFKQSGIRFVRILIMLMRNEDNKEFLFEDRRDEVNSLPN